MAVRWGVLGAGSVAQRRVMPTMKARADCELKALMVRDMGRAERLAQTFGAERCYDRAAALLDDPEVDAIYVSSPPYLHCEHVVAAAERGKHVLCEKPMATSEADCRQMIAACETAGVHLEVCFVLRGWPVYHRVKGVLDSGRLGRIVELRAHLAKWTPRNEGDWRLDPAKGGGGALMDVGSHYLDLFRFLAGEFRRIAYMGSSAVFNYPVEESGFILVEFEARCHGVLGATYAVPNNGNLLEVYGTEGTLVLGKEMRISTAEGETAEPAEFPDYYSGLLSNFCRCAEQGGRPMASGLDGLKNLQTVLAAYRAGREGRILEVGE